MPGSRHAYASRCDFACAHDSTCFNRTAHDLTVQQTVQLLVDVYTSEMDCPLRGSRATQAHDALPAPPLTQAATFAAAPFASALRLAASSLAVRCLM